MFFFFATDHVTVIKWDRKARPRVKIQKKKHFSKLCKQVDTSVTSLTLATYLLPLLLKQATVYVMIGKNEATTLMDTGSYGFIISLDYAKRHQIKKTCIWECVHGLSILSALIKGNCTVILYLLGDQCLNVTLCVLPNLCIDVILGQDFRKQHTGVTFAFGGPKKYVFILSSTSCSLPSSIEDIPPLY